MRSTGTLDSLPSASTQRGGFRRGVEKRADFAACAVQGEVFQGTGAGEQEKQQRALAPGPQRGRAGGGRQHEEVDVQRSLADAFPGVLGGIPATGHQGHGVKYDGQPGGRVGKFPETPSR